VTERQLTTEFSKYLKLHPRKETEVYEFKMIKSKSFPLASVKEHQIAGLEDALEGLWHKISDSPIFAGMNSKFTKQKPFDAVFIKAKNAYVVPIFYEPRKFKKAFLIPVVDFVLMKDSWPRKSIRLEELEELGFEMISL